MAPTAHDPIAELHQEVIEFQKARAELWRWKILIVAALGAAAFGINAEVGELKTTKVERGIPFVLSLIPIVCAYVDTLIVHLRSRTKLIGRWRAVKSTSDEWKSYENFLTVAASRLRLWIFEETAVFGATLVLDVAIGAAAAFNVVNAEKYVRISLLMFSAVGFVYGLALLCLFKRRAAIIDRLPAEGKPSICAANARDAVQLIVECMKEDEKRAANVSQIFRPLDKIRDDLEREGR